MKRDKIRSTMRSIDKDGQKAVWDLVGEMAGKDRSVLPLLEGANNDEEAAQICNKYYLNKVDKIRTTLFFNIYEIKKCSSNIKYAYLSQ